MTLQFQRPIPPAASLRAFAGNLSPGRPHPPALYLVGKFSAQLAQNALLAALLVTAGTHGQASIGLSGFFVAMLIPAVLFGPLGGAIVDRLSPAVGYTLGAGLRALAILPAFFLIGSPHQVWVVAAAYSLASQVFTPSEFALVHYIQGSRPGRMYSALTSLQYAGQGAGILLFAPALYFIGGQPAVFLGVVAVFTMVSLIGLAMVASGVGEETSAPSGASHDSAFSFGSVSRFLFRDGTAFYAVVALTLAGIISRVLVVSLPRYVRDEVSIGPLGLLFVVVPGVLGLISGLIWTSRKLSLDRAPDMLRFSSLGLLGGLVLLAFVDDGVTLVAQSTAISPVQDAEAWLNTTAAVVVPAAFAGGFGLCVVIMSARFVLTELAPRGACGRVHAVQGLITESILVVPVLFAGVATALAGARITLAIVSILAVVALASMEWRRMRPAGEPAASFEPDPVAPIAIARPAD